ncbi:MAG TPA: hypothetical protein VGM81_04050 [Burkholderiaceae bacterium]
MSESTSAPRVQRMHQILLWPLRLMPLGNAAAAPVRPWELLLAQPDSPWREVVDEYTGELADFHERHYQEFVTFLPYVQRFLYGEGREGTGSGMKVLRRSDIAQLRARTRPGAAPVTLDVVHVDLYFFFDVDVVLLNVELSAADLELSLAQDLLYRIGRAYPSGWDAKGLPLHMLAESEWLAADGTVLARSDATERERFMAHVGAQRAPRLTEHWDFVLRPLASEHASEPGLLSFRQIEYYRMPMMAWLALDDPQKLSRGDFVRFGLVTGNQDDVGEHMPELPPESLPFAGTHLEDFERRYCYDRFWHAGGAAPHTRYLCSGHALVVVGRADADFFCCRDRGVLAQFRHQHFLVFLIAHFQKAALLMFSDRLAEALRRLDVSNADNVRRFKRAIRGAFEGFLRFSHRYWFHAVSDQAQTRALYRMSADHLELDTLHAEVKTRVIDMSSYLDADSLRRQANTVVRLTVVTVLGLIGSVTTGFLGMNLLAEADAPMLERVLVFAAALGGTVALTLYTMAKSKRLSDFLDVLSDERLSWGAKWRVFFAVWRRGGG